MEDVFAKYLKQLEQITFIHAQGVPDNIGKEFHAYHEIIYIIEGSVTFISDNMHVTAEPNTLIVIPCETYHQVLIEGPLKKHQRGVFHFVNLPELKELISQSMKEVILINVNRQMRSIYNRMIALFDQHYSHDSDCLIMESALTMLLHEIILNIDSTTELEVTDTISKKSIDYITEHISEPISVADIAKELNISVSGLAHIFKSQMNISIYQYILKKKLITARHKILAGESVTQVAIDCGFNDYSGFYKQYKKMFNISPSSKKQEIIDVPQVPPSLF